MTWIICTVFLAVLFVIAFVIHRGVIAYAADGRTAYEERKNAGRYGGTEPLNYPPAVGRAVMAGIVGLWLLATILLSTHVVPSGNVGVVRTFGVIDGQRHSGIVLIMPWQTLDQQDVKVQHYVFADTNCNTDGQCDRKDRLTAASSDSQDVFIDATFNYSLSESKVQDLLRSVGTNWFQVVVYPRVINDVKEQTVKYKATEVLQNREKIRNDTKDRLTAELAPFSISVQDFLINNVAFDPAFNQAINDAQTAQQKAIQATNDAQAAINKAEGDKQAAIKAAEGEAQATQVKADAQAKANQELAASVTPQLVQYIEAQAHMQWRPSVIGSDSVIVQPAAAGK